MRLIVRKDGRVKAFKSAGLGPREACWGIGLTSTSPFLHRDLSFTNHQ